MNSVLKQLDLSYNNLTDSGVQNIFQKLKHRNCVLEILRLNGCDITGESCRTLGSVLSRSRLKKLQLGPSRIGDDGLKLLSAALRTNSTLHLLGLTHCNLTGASCTALASALSSDSSALRVLDLSNNDLEDSGVKLLSAGLKSPHCKLEILRLSGCMITEEGCSSLASVLKSNTSNLRELDLSYNHPGESGEELLSKLLEDPHCKLNSVNLDNGGEQRMKPGLRKYACDLGNFTLANEWEIEEWKRFMDGKGFMGLSKSRFYWQVEWTGVVRIGVKYKEAWKNDWCLHCSRDAYSPGLLIYAEYNEQIKQLGVYLDWQQAC
ncbi:NACHT, LRR and PYD domains-containing protein 12-like [Colossoma macropomum]|uniref:NACHT, LRR and PYD domains-containing protein 12-like n=1 Tax=Colossoma macropomum TaxID=42526 RepID=UPI0018650DDC|nr:NACHT, LRR and PYD domains-containing protein 12-like [Colossoma macropomum]